MIHATPRHLLRNLSAAGLFVVVVVSCHAPLAYAWGPDGHQIIADVATNYMLRTTRIKANELLAKTKQNFPNLRSAAIWADDVRTVRPWTAPWHYVGNRGTPLVRPCSLTFPEDCPNNNCLTAAIGKNAEVLVDPNASDAARGDALAYLAHFVGDAAQPLHASGYSNGFKDVPVLFNNEQQSLHYIWDGPLVRRAMYQFATRRGEKPVTKRVAAQRYVARLVKFAPRLISTVPGVKCAMRVDKAEDTREAAQACAEEWAREANALVCSVAYPKTFQKGQETAKQYATAVVGTIDQQLLRAGIRLAALLNALFAEPD